MPTITIYTTQTCPYCVRAKSFLNQKGFSDITEIDVTHDAEMRETMMQKAGGRRTVPQIVINDTHVGGFDDMVALDQDGKLESLLAS